MWGWHRAAPSGTPLDTIYSTLQLFWLQGAFDPGGTPWQLNVARFSGFFVLLSTVVTAFYALFRAGYARWMVRRSRKHTIVCGLGRKGFEVVRALRAAGEPVVVILLDEENDLLPAAKGLGARALVADATEARTLLEARLPRARQLLVLCNMDSENVKIAETARGLLEPAEGGDAQGTRRERPVSCKVLLYDDNLWQQLDRLKITESSDALSLEYFSFFDRAAEELILGDSVSRPSREGRPDARRVAVVGDGQFARAVGAHLLEAWTAPHEGHVQRELQLWSGRAEEMREDLLDELGSRGGAEPEIMIAARTEAKDLAALDAPHAVLNKAIPNLEGIERVYVCLTGEHRTVAAALAIEEELRTKLPQQLTHVTACLLNADAMGRLLSSGMDPGAAAGRRLGVFDMMRCLRDPELLYGDFHEVLARGIHKRYAARNKGKRAGVPWEEISADDRERNLGQARRYGRYLKTLGLEVTRRRGLVPDALTLSQDEIDAIASMEHARWMPGKLAQDYVYGEKTDDAQKTNEYLLEWDELDNEHKEEGRQEVADMPEILAEAGFYVFRVGQSAPSDGGEG